MAAWLAFGRIRRCGRPGCAGPAAISAGHGAVADAARAAADAIVETEGVEAGGQADLAVQPQGGEPVAGDIDACQSRDEPGDKSESGCEF